MDDIARIAALDRHTPDPAEVAELRRLLMQRLAIDPDGCPMPLWDSQVAALAHAQAAGGLVGVLAVGAGKTLTSLLLPVVLQSQTPLLIIPASLRAKTLREMEVYRQHYRIPPIHIMSYAKLSTDKDADGVSRLLDRIAPDLIVMDEAHKALNVRSGCVSKLRRYISDKVPRVCVMSGTLYRSSLMDVHHLMAWALKLGSPLPLSPGVCRTWARAVDPCPDEFEQDRLQAAEWGGVHAIGIHADDPRDVVGERIRCTYGVVTDCSDHDGPIEFDTVEIDPSPLTDELRQQVRAGTSPTGDEIVGGFETWRHVQTLAAGFYNRWDPPPPAGWRRKRSAWKRFAAGQIELGYYDTEEGVARAVDYGKLPDGVKLLAAWRKAREEYQPNSVPVWIDEDAPVLHYAARWLQDGPGRLCWVGDVPVGQRIAALAGVPFFGAGQGQDGVPMIEDADGASCVLTLSANAAGRNLQAWYRNLFLVVPSKARDYEQAIGRTHRPGQTRTVYVTVCICTPEHRKALDAVQGNAEFVATMSGIVPKILSADGAL